MMVPLGRVDTCAAPVNHGDVVHTALYPFRHISIARDAYLQCKTKNDDMFLEQYTVISSIEQRANLALLRQRLVLIL